MDYLTNYYKNLCEKLQHKLNALETTVKHLQEAQSAYTDEEYKRYYGDDGMGGGVVPRPTRDISTQMPTSSTDRYGNPVDDVLNNWGPNGGVGDLNGDGRIDGADLGLALDGGGIGYRSGGGVDSGVQRTPTRDTSTGNQSDGYTPKRPMPPVTRPTTGTGNQTDGSYPRMPVPPVTRPTTDTGNQTEGMPPRRPTPPVVRPTTSAGNQTEGPGYRTPSTRPTTGTGNETEQGAPGDLGDLNGDGRVDGADLGMYLARYGQAPTTMKYTRTGQVVGTSPFNPRRRPNSSY